MRLRHDLKFSLIVASIGTAIVEAMFIYQYFDMPLARDADLRFGCVAIMLIAPIMMFRLVLGGPCECRRCTLEREATGKEAK